MKDWTTAKSTDEFWASGTSLQGYITATRYHIQRIFGEPTYTNGIEDKVTVEWVISFDTEEEDQVIATIYDWKRYEQGTPAMDELIYWNIGGHSTEAVERVAKALGVTALPYNYPVYLGVGVK